METKLLQLRQEAAREVVANGDYTVALSVPQKIEAGDVLTLSKAFLDTRTPEGTVELAQDVDCTVSGLLYAQYFDAGGKTSAPADIDNEAYVLCENTAATLADRILIQKLDSDLHHGDITWGGANVVFAYEDPQGNPRTWSYPVPKEKHKGSYTMDVNIYTKPDTWEVKTDIHAYRMKLGHLSKQTVNLNTGCLPDTRKLAFTLVAGSYTPAQLADEVSRQLQTLKQPATFGAFDQYKDSPMYLNSDTLTWNGTTVPGHRMIRVDGGESFEYDGTSHYAVGASQMALEFDQDKGRFRFSYLHSPLYDTTSSNIDVRAVQVAAGPPALFSTVTRGGGVFLTSLEPASLWYDTLGFSPKQMINWDIQNIGGDSRPVFSNAEASTTQGLVSVGSFVDKKDFEKIPDANNFTATAPDTVPVTALTTFQANLSAANLSHYVIEVLGLPGHGLEMVTWADHTFAARAVVGAYYSANGYTSLDSSQLVTEHVGEPATVASFRVRVLAPDGSVAPLGTENDIYLTLQKKRSN